MGKKLYGTAVPAKHLKPGDVFYASALQELHGERLYLCLGTRRLVSNSSLITVTILQTTSATPNELYLPSFYEVRVVKTVQVSD